MKTPLDLSRVLWRSPRDIVAGRWSNIERASVQAREDSILVTELDARGVLRTCQYARDKSMSGLEQVGWMPGAGQ